MFCGLRFRAEKYFFFGLVLVGLAVCATPSHAQLTAKDILDKEIEEFSPKYQAVDDAIQKLREGDAQTARQMLDQAYKNNPELPPGNVMLAQILFASRQIQLGRAALEEAKKEAPNDPGAYVYMGDLALNERRLTDCELLYKEGIEKCKSYNVNDKRKKRLLAMAYSGLANLKEVAEDWNEAEKLLRTTLQYDSENLIALTRLGRVLFKKATDLEGEKAAYAVFKQLHQIDSERTPLPEINMALLYQQDGKTANAKKLMQAALGKDSNNARTLLAVAKWALDANELEMAQTNANNALKLEPDSLEAKLYIGLVARYKGQFDIAERVFKEAHLQSPKHAGALTQLALILIESDDKTKQQLALEFADLSVRIYPDMTSSYGRESMMTLAWCLAKQGNLNAAMQATAKALEKGSVTADSAYFAAQILYDAGQSANAGKILDSALKSERSFPNRSAAEALKAKIGG
ncbi:MAG: tetratricopeptide repeat protein [Planctomycetales bacterium]|nr:tetratricopeptide repeat protein [Planctomycetales bacterium]